jgi:hypothetical protein
MKFKSNDQRLLEEAYKKIDKSTSTKTPALFKDKKGNPIHQGNTVKFNSVIYKIVGGKTVLGTGIDKDMIQLEQAEGTVIGDIPKLIWVRPNQVVKVH